MDIKVLKVNLFEFTLKIIKENLESCLLNMSLYKYPRKNF